MSASAHDEAAPVFDGLCHAFESGRLGHAYLIVGSPKGEAGALTIRLLQLVFSGEGVDEAALTRRLEERLHPDVTWLEPRSKGRNISADEVRSLNQRISTTSYGGGWKAGVVLHAERMQPAGANAFLKTLEEPPDRSLLVLVTDAPHHLLPTIVSRCQRVNMLEAEQVPRGDWRESLTALLRRGPPGDPLEACCLGAEMTRLLKEERSTIEEEERASWAGREVDETVLDARVSSRIRETQDAMMRALLLWHRDILLCATDGPRDALHYPGEADTLETLAQRQTPGSALVCLHAVEEGRERLDRNLPPLPVLEGMLIAQGRASMRTT